MIFLWTSRSFCVVLWISTSSRDSSLCPSPVRPPSPTRTTASSHRHRRVIDLIASIMSARSALLALGRNTAFAPMCATTMTAIGARAYSTGTWNRDRIATSQSRRHRSSASSSSVVFIGRHHPSRHDRPTDGTNGTRRRGMRRSRIVRSRRDASFDGGTCRLDARQPSIRGGGARPSTPPRRERARRRDETRERLTGNDARSDRGFEVHALARVDQGGWRRRHRRYHGPRAGATRERAIRLGGLSYRPRERRERRARERRRGEDETRVSARARNDLVVLIDPND